MLEIQRDVVRAIHVIMGVTGGVTGRVRGAVCVAEHKQGLILLRFGCCSKGVRSLIKATSLYCCGIKFNFIISH